MISETQKLEDLDIDYDQGLGFKTGDLGMVRVRSYRCTVRKDPSIIKKRLILTQIICMDLESYDRKIEEAGSFIRFNHHPNIATLYSYWVSAPESVSYYKSINMLYEEATVGDLTRCLVLNPLKPSKTTVSKYICDLAKGSATDNLGLGMLHQSDVVHGAIRTSNLFINEDNHLVLGPIKKSETENLREMTHLVSKYNIGKYIKQFFIYWAPEVFNGEPITIKSDVWAVGVVIFVLLTGEYPFDTNKEDSLMNNIRDANVNWRPMIDHPKMVALLRNVLCAKPSDRWNINQILSHCQEEFIIMIQRCFRGYLDRKQIKIVKNSIKKIQAATKGWLVRKKYQNRRFQVRWQAAKLIQKKFKDFRATETLRNLKKLTQVLQSKVLGRQIRRAYLKLRKDTITAQSFVRKLLVYTSYRAINYKKAELVQDLSSKSQNMDRYTKLANVYFPIQSGSHIQDLRNKLKQQKYKRGERIVEVENEDDEDDQTNQILGRKKE